MSFISFFRKSLILSASLRGISTGPVAELLAQLRTGAISIQEVYTGRAVGQMLFQTPSGFGIEIEIQKIIQKLGAFSTGHIFVHAHRPSK